MSFIPLPSAFEGGCPTMGHLPKNKWKEYMKHHICCNWCMQVTPPKKLELIIDESIKKEEEEKIITETSNRNILKKYKNYSIQILNIYQTGINIYFNQFSIIGLNIYKNVIFILDKILDILEYSKIEITHNIPFNFNYKFELNQLKEKIKLNTTKETLIMLINNMISIIENAYLIIENETKIYYNLDIFIKKYTDESIYMLPIFIGINKVKYTTEINYLNNLQNLFILQLFNFIDNKNKFIIHKYILNCDITYNNKILSNLHNMVKQYSLLIIN